MFEDSLEEKNGPLCYRKIMNMRIERDSLGEVSVPEEAYWGAQTERARQNFPISTELQPKEIILALLLIKKACALVNAQCRVLSSEKSALICQVVDEILQNYDLYAQHFPLVIWQTGSGTQTNMNVNEVIANRASEIQHKPRGSKNPLHPNDDVNKSQSTNDVFPSAIHIAATIAIRTRLIPALKALAASLAEKSVAFQAIEKVGRTHLMDAASLTLGQEFSGYVAQIEHGIQALEYTLPGIAAIALGGTAVGTGMNAPENFGPRAAQVLSELTGYTFTSAPNKFEALACHDALVSVSGALKRLACALYKIANDIRWMASGPRTGLHEIVIPENEPGSSIMPGKVNPTQCEALTMVACQVLGNDSVIGFADCLGNFELNVYKPLIGYALMQSITLLTEAAQSFTDKCVIGIQANEAQLAKNVQASLMHATTLTPIIGYDNATKIVQMAHKENISIPEAAKKLGIKLSPPLRGGDN